MFQQYYVYILTRLKLNRKTKSPYHKQRRLLCLIFQLYMGNHLVEWYLLNQNQELIFEFYYYHDRQYTKNHRDNTNHVGNSIDYLTHPVNQIFLIYSNTKNKIFVTINQK